MKFGKIKLILHFSIIDNNQQHQQHPAGYFCGVILTQCFISEVAGETNTNIVENVCSKKS